MNRWQEDVTAQQWQQVAQSASRGRGGSLNSSQDLSPNVIGK